MYMLYKTKMCFSADYKLDPNVLVKKLTTFLKVDFNYYKQLDDLYNKYQYSIFDNSTTMYIKAVRYSTK